MAADEEEEGGGGDSFRLLFVTLSMILLAFFILLNSMATLSESKMRLALGSLLGSFGLLPGSSSVESKDRALSSQSDKIVTGQGYSVFRKINEMIENLNRGTVEPGAKVAAIFDESTGDITVVAADQMLFRRGQWVINPKMFHLLAQVAAIAEQFESPITVTGHTDRTGRMLDNWHLSLRRAAVVARNISSRLHGKDIAVVAQGRAHFDPINRLDPRLRDMTPRRVEITVSTRKE